MRRNRLLLSCLVIFVAGVPARASAPSSSEVDALEEKLNQSHFIDPNKFGLPAGDTEELFLQRLKTIHGKEVLREKVQREQLDELIQNRNLVKEFLEKFEVSKLPAELRAKIAGREAELQDFIRSMTTEEFLKYAQEAHGIHRSSEAGGAQPGTSTPAQAAPSAGEPAQKPTTPPMGESKSQEGPASEASSTEQPANSVLGRWLLQAASRFKDLDPALRDSPALRRIVRELNGKLDGADERWKQLDQAANAIAEKFAHLGETLPLDRLLPEHGLSWPRSLSGESWRWRFPETGPRLPVAAPNLPRTGVPDWGRLDGWRALWMLVILTALGLILWKTVRHAPLRGVSASDSWKLGPWPVQPTAVQTREQLIQAFEYLSLLHLGPAARHWHHWTIARGLGQSAGNPAIDRRRAAEQLAFLYEQARYAPAAEPLPETALATARRDLCLLAGVSVS